VPSSDQIGRFNDDESSSILAQILIFVFLPVFAHFRFPGDPAFAYGIVLNDAGEVTGLLVVASDNDKGVAEKSPKNCCQMGSDV
jgi:hypothetical protein